MTTIPPRSLSQAVVSLYGVYCYMHFTCVKSFSCQTEPLVTGNIGHRLAADHKVLRSIALQTSMYSQSELDLESGYAVD